MHRMKKYTIYHFMTIYIIVFNHRTDKSFANNANNDWFHVSEQQEKAKQKHPWGASSCLLVGVISHHHSAPPQNMQLFTFKI